MTPSVTSSPASGPSGSSTNWAAVGGSIGGGLGGFVVVISIALILYWRRRKSKRISKSLREQALVNTSEVETKKDQINEYFAGELHGGSRPAEAGSTPLYEADEGGRDYRERSCNDLLMKRTQREYYGISD